MCFLSLSLYRQNIYVIEALYSKYLTTGMAQGFSQSEWALATNCWYSLYPGERDQAEYQPTQQAAFPKSFAQRTLLCGISQNWGERLWPQCWNCISLGMGPGLMILTTGVQERGSSGKDSR